MVSQEYSVLIFISQTAGMETKNPGVGLRVRRLVMGRGQPKSAVRAVEITT